MTKIVPLAQFVESVRTALAEHYLGLPYSAIQDEQAFNEMRAYILQYYEGVISVHAFVDAGNAVFDCIPIRQQFSLRGHTGAAAVAPAPPGSTCASDTGASRPSSKQHPPPGTIPVRRLTLEDLSRFSTLGHFLRKAPTPPEARERR